MTDKQDLPPLPERIWTCKIGGPTSRFPDGADLPMRNAVRDAFAMLTGSDPVFIFSGWGGSLTEDERAVVEKRQPAIRSHEAARGAQAEQLTALQREAWTWSKACEAEGKKVYAARLLVSKWRHAAEHLGLKGLASLADCADELEEAIAAAPTPGAAAYGSIAERAQQGLDAGKWASNTVKAEAPSEHAELMKFYSVDSLDALVTAQAHHIEKLQAKLPRDNQPAFTRVREG